MSGGLVQYGRTTKRLSQSCRQENMCNASCIRLHIRCRDYRNGVSLNEVHESPTTCDFSLRNILQLVYSEYQCFVNM